MMSKKLRLGLAILLFAAWLSYLGYIAFTSARPIVLSRPQFLNANIDVIAVVAEKDGHPSADVEIERVLWVAKGQHEPKDKKVTVHRLDKVTKANGWIGPGRYVLPIRSSQGDLELASIPRSPGYPEKAYEDGPPRIYPATPETEAQHRRIREAYGK